MEDSFLSISQKIANPFLIFKSIPLNEFSKNSYLAQKMHLIVLYNHAKNEKILSAVLEKG